MNFRKVMFMVERQYKGVGLGECFSAVFEPKTKRWLWHDGKNNRYYVPSAIMRRHFKIIKPQKGHILL